ncbi:P-loop containing nucleoside triphosphate hydrolase protein [Annulohypoxylon truncatum]|uniref:P-loop containing nucleoside triphosphate hydrolase protein n=1 Tax=Annulohypoxylon truncatum TaxID=327061 RepID=UPI002008D903|nr:P-loop containing nucleoside triphosphate hydrolase protein [Annulohypoxylon truncatum]KAI1211080.1 P-loop containing nucleoside triphosphate hydrolase protein [Annulohypoxylon truncatum]
MPRQIDTVPTPAHVKPKKLIVLSAPRTGTHGLYLALKELGFKPYHMAEVLKAGAPAVKIMNDGLNAEMFHIGEPYTRAEFDKWFADYDVINEMPFFMLHSIIKAYPDAKFLLTERNPEKWAKSFVNTIGMLAVQLKSFPMSVFRFFDEFTYGMGYMGNAVLGYYSNGYGLTPTGQKYLAENYRNYIAEVKRIVPPEQLLVCKLEDGFGWNEICPYLGVPIPKTEWPSLNKPEEFHEVAGPKIQHAFTKGLVGMTSMVVPVVAVGFWYLRKGRLAI